MMKQLKKSICCKCKGEFNSDTEYINHTCPTTGFKPNNPEHLGKAFMAQSKKALERGEARKN